MQRRYKESTVATRSSSGRPSLPHSSQHRHHLARPSQKPITPRGVAVSAGPAAATANVAVPAASSAACTVAPAAPKVAPSPLTVSTPQQLPRPRGSGADRGARRVPPRRWTPSAAADAVAAGRPLPAPTSRRTATIAGTAEQAHSRGWRWKLSRGAAAGAPPSRYRTRPYLPTLCGTGAAAGKRRGGSGSSRRLAPKKETPSRTPTCMFCF